MDEQFPSVPYKSNIYNAANIYDITTAMGNQRLSEEWEALAEADANPADFPAQLRMFVMQLGILALMAIGFTIFG